MRNCPSPTATTEVAATTSQKSAECTYFPGSSFSIGRPCIQIESDSDRRKREVPLLPATRPRKKRRREDDGPSSGLPVYASAATAVADPHSSPNCHDRRGVTRGLQGLQGPFQSLALFFRHCIEKRLLESCELSAKTLISPPHAAAAAP